MTDRIPLETLLGETERLRTHARAILGDTHRAEDVVQDAAIKALRSAPVHADARGLRAWLAEVTRNLARSSARSEARRAARERAASLDERVAPVDETLDRALAQRRLVEALVELGDLDRRVVMLRYIDGLPPRAIARTLDTTPNAVRTRLSRALSKLRTRLDDEGAGGRRALALLAMEPRRSAASAVGGTAVGGALVHTMTKLGLAAAVIVAALALLVTRDGDVPRRVPSDLSRVDDSVAAPSLSGVAKETKRGPDRVSSRLAEAAPNDVATPVLEPPSSTSAKTEKLVVLARIVDGSGAPLSGASLTATDLVDPVTAESNSDGRVRGTPFPGLFTASSWGRSDGDGRYRLDGVPARSVSIVAKGAGHYHAYSAPADVPIGGMLRIPDLRVERVRSRNRIEGTIVDEHGPVAGAQASIWPNRGARNVNPLTRAIADSDGHFGVTVLADAECTIEAHHADSYHRSVVVHDVKAGSLDVEVRFPVTRELVVRAVDEEGDAITESEVHLRAADGNDVVGRSRRPTDYGAHVLAEPAVPYHWWVRAHGYRATWGEAREPGEGSATVDVALARAPCLSGRVLANGAPVRGAEVHAHAPPYESPIVCFGGTLYSRWSTHEGRPPTAHTDDDGRFELFLPADGTFLLHASAEDLARAEAGPFTIASGEQGAGIELNLEPGAKLEGRVLVAEGVDVEGTVVAITRGDGHVESTAVGADGRYSFAPLTPGDWQVERARSSDVERLRVERTYGLNGTMPEIPVDVHLTRGRTARFDLDLREDVPCVVRGQLSVDGGWDPGWRSSLTTDEDFLEGLVDPQGLLRLTHLGAVDARLMFRRHRANSAYETLERQVRLDPGTTDVEWTVTTGSVAIDGLPPPEPAYPGSGAKGYALVHMDDDGWTWTLRFDPSDGGQRSLDDVPAGTIELRRRRAIGDTRPRFWRVIGSFEVRLGERTEFVVPKDD